MVPVKFPEDENITYHYYSWDKLGDLTEKLAFKILNSNLHFDRIVALATGGLTMSRVLKDYLAVKNLSTMQIEFYTDIAKTKPFPIITQTLSTNVEGEVILVFDDINDTGKTLKVAKDYLSLRGAEKIYTATIFQKPHTSCPSDFYQEETTAWIIFPDEVRETIELLSKRWSKKVSKEEIKERLLKIGFSRLQVERFLNGSRGKKHK